ncbi:hypothetical protein HYX12_00540 [Candidatus Woesearchaeota archaeon]|nr:hypothetical protein [Candidatus Woesearchaeota archaeon]
MLTLPKNFLKDENTLLFSLSSPGIFFWSTNLIVIENLKIVADVTDLEAQRSKYLFLVSETEKSNLEKVVLKFQPDCLYDEVGPLRITVNGNELYRGIPDCDLAFVPIEFSPELVKKGENEIEFYTERGAYLLSHVLINSELKELDFPTYYFDLSHEQFNNLANGKEHLRLKMEFVDVTSSKFGEIVFNGFQNHFDTKEVSLALDLSKDAVKGTNSLKIKPKKTIEVRELKVDLVR